MIFYWRILKKSYKKSELPLCKHVKQTSKNEISSGNTTKTQRENRYVILMLISTFSFLSLQGDFLRNLKLP